MVRSLGVSTDSRHIDATAKEIVMHGQQQVVSDEERQELGIRRMCDALKERMLARREEWAKAKPIVQALVEMSVLRVDVAPIGTPKHDRAEARRTWFEAWYRKLGFEVTVPKPNISNREFARREKAGQILVYRPATSDVSYEAFMAAVGQGTHWTVTDQAERDKIGWEPTEHGYWFWADAQDSCPRLGTTWNDLMKAVRLLALEEYVILWHAVKEETGRMLDTFTWCWLRTRYGSGVLNAGGFDGGVFVRRGSAGNLAISNGNYDGRAADVVKQ